MQEGWSRVIQEGDLICQCWSCGFTWFMDFEPELDHCPSELFRLGVVQEGKIEWGTVVDSDGKVWQEDWWAGDAPDA